MLNAGPEAQGAETVAFWRDTSPMERFSGERRLRVLTARGPRWIRAAQVELLSIPSVKIWPVPPFLHELMDLSHVVGVAEVKAGLIWLVDPKRFRPPEAGVESV